MYALTFLTSNLFLPSVAVSAAPDFDDFIGALALDVVAGSASGISTSAMVDGSVMVDCRRGRGDPY